jgi:tight adherence protein B
MQVGGNLSDILEVISQTIKDRIKIKAEVRVLTSSGRTSGLIIGLLPVLIVVVLMLLNPQYFESFLDDVIGKIMIVTSIVLETAGFLAIKKIVNIEY